MSSDDPNLQPEERERLLRILREGMKALQGEFKASRPSCPDSSTMVDYVLGYLDVQQVQDVNRHIAFCKTCFDDLLALLGPDKVKRLFDGEQVIGGRGEAMQARSQWQKIIERARQAVLEFGKAYGPDTLIGSLRILASGPAPTMRGVTFSKIPATVVEIPVGPNVYGISLSARDDGFVFDVAGYQTPDQHPARVEIASEEGDPIVAADTDGFGNVRLMLPQNEGSNQRVVVTMTLGKENWESFSVLLPKIDSESS